MKRAIYLIVAVIFAIAVPLQFAINARSPMYIDNAEESIAEETIVDIEGKDAYGDLSDDNQVIENGNEDGNGISQENGSEAAESGESKSAGDVENGVQEGQGGYDEENTQTVITDTGIKVQSLVNSLNIRTGPSTSSKVIGSLSAGAKVDYIEGQDGWYKVRYGDEVAYVSANISYTRLIDTNAGSAMAMIHAVIDEGLKVLGTPYEYGSQRILLWDGTLNKYFTGKTFDCSAFVQYIFYKGASVKLKGDSRSQSLQGIQVPLDKLQKGDLIFMTSSTRMNNTGIEKIGHVALYIGNNKIMHTFGTGGVRIQEYSEFWRGRAITVKRIVY